MKKVNIFSLHLCKRQSKKYLFFLSVLIPVTFLVYGFLFTRVYASESITKDYVVTSGSDVSSGTPSPLTDSQLGRISASDDKTRLTSDPWPKGGVYDESRYLEFIFSPDVPNDAVIDSVFINNEYRRSGALDGSKLEVWNGTEFKDFEITKGSINVDQLDSVDLTSYLNTPDRVNSIKVRFLAYRGEGADTTTGHDFVGVTVVYHASEVITDPPVDPPEDPPVDPPAEVSYTEVGGLISEDTTWTKDKSPYLVTDSISVGGLTTLTIEPGVVVKFSGGASLIVEGILKAEGTATDKICFTSYLDEYPCNDLKNEEEGTSAGQGDWDSVVINNSKDKSTVNYLIERYSSLGFILYGGSSVNSDSLDTDKYISGFSSSSTFSNIKALRVDLYEGSSFSINNSSILNESGAAILAQGNSHLILNNSKVSSSGSNYFISVYDGSSAIFNGVEVIGSIPSVTAVAVFENSSLVFNNSSVDSVNSGFEVFNNSSLSFSNSSVNCTNDGFSIFNNSSLSMSGGSTSCSHDGILVFGDSSSDIKNTKISGASDSGIIAYGNTKPDAVKVTKSEIFENDYGFISWDTPVLINKNSIHDNFSGGVLTFLTSSNPTPITLNFTSNYWGDPSGPIHSSNPNGKGEEVSDYVNFLPFLKSDPLINIRNPVIIIPGITGTYLYKGYDDKGEIWPNAWNTIFSIADTFLKDLALNKDGTENSEKQIKLGDIIRNIYSIGVHVFDKLITEFTNNGYVEGTDLFVFPYDWRLSTKTNAGLLNDEINKILSDTGQEKVDIVAHSMGGLLAKKYIADNGEDKVDQLIFLGTPQLGAPKAFKALMFGDSMGFSKFGVSLLKLSVAKSISQNMPSVYELLPSVKYIQDNGSYIIDAMQRIIGLDSFNLDYKETKDLMIDKGRNKLMFPFAEDLHRSIDDLDLSNVKTYNIVGCGSPTIGGVEMTQKRSWKKLFLGLVDDYNLKYVDGDETVPFVSSTKTIGSDIYYAKGVSHGDLPSADGVRQNVVSILNDDPVITTDTFTSDSSSCGIKGKVVSTHSPVELNIYDKEGNHTGPNENGDIENGVLGVQYDILDHTKYAFLPDGVDYEIVTKATDTGGYNFMIEDQNNSENITSVNKWTLIPLSTLNTTGEIWVGPDYSPDNYEVKVDQDGDGKIDDNYKASYDGTSLAETLTVPVKENYNSSGSYPKIIDIINNIPEFSFKDKESKIFDYKVPQSIKTPSINNKKQNEEKLNTNSDSKDKESNISNKILASALLSDSNINNIKKFTFIGLSVFALWLAIRFIIKVI